MVVQQLREPQSCLNGHTGKTQESSIEGDPHDLAQEGDKTHSSRKNKQELHWISKSYTVLIKSVPVPEFFLLPQISGPIRVLHALVQQQCLPIKQARTWMMMMNMAWNNRFIAYPLVIQKYMRNMADIIRMAHTYIENDPVDFYLRISCSWE